MQSLQLQFAPQRPEPERAWHATTSNARSIGIEIANIGAFPPGSAERAQEWYQRREHGPPLITIPDSFGDGGQRTKGFTGRPARPEPIRGNIQGRDLEQYDFTPEQYRALVRLTAALVDRYAECDDHGARLRVTLLRLTADVADDLNLGHASHRTRSVFSAA